MQRSINNADETPTRYCKTAVLAAEARRLQSWVIERALTTQPNLTFPDTTSGMFDVAKG